MQSMEFLITSILKVCLSQNDINVTYTTSDLTGSFNTTNINMYIYNLFFRDYSFEDLTFIISLIH